MTLAAGQVPDDARQLGHERGGVPFVSDADLKTALAADVPPQTADAVVDENTKARLDGLRASLSVLAVIALIALFFSRGMPTRQPGAAPEAQST